MHQCPPHKLTSPYVVNPNYVLDISRYGYNRVPNLEFVDAVDLRELHVVVKQGLSDDVEDTQPLRGREKERNWVRFRLNIV